MDARRSIPPDLRRSPAALARALRLPYAALVLTVDGTDDVAGSSVVAMGRGPSGSLVAGGATLGRIEVSPRGHGQRRRRSRPNCRDRRAPCRLRRRGAPARPGRQRCPRTARRRAGGGTPPVANDLHDGLGPLLAGARMQLAAAGRSRRRRTAVRPGRGGRRRSRDGDAVVQGTRRGLRPAALDDGLVAALGAAVTGLLPDCATTVGARRPPGTARSGGDHRIATECRDQWRGTPGAPPGCVVPPDRRGGPAADRHRRRRSGRRFGTGSQPGAACGRRAEEPRRPGKLHVRPGGRTTVRALLPLAARGRIQDVVPGVPAENR